MKDNEYISIVKAETVEYPKAEDCFIPDKDYPENPFIHRGTNPKNRVYNAVREALHTLKMDEAHYGTKEWNPFKDVINPGETVLVKPNLVMHRNKSEAGTDCLYTQSAVVAPVIDYIYIALKGFGKIIIGDAPMQECDFKVLLEQSGYASLVSFYKNQGLDIEIVDFRELKSESKNGLYIQKINTEAKGRIIDLKDSSEFHVCDSEMIKKMRITNYDPRVLNTHHTDDVHEYYVSDDVLSADVIINMSKPKTHRKAGATISLKNMIGINLRKEFLPHHTMGAKGDGGDEYNTRSTVHKFRSYIDDEINELCANKHYTVARLLKFPRRACSLILKLMGHNYSEGSWYGNHTISKTISDINKIVYYADKQGIMRDTLQRKVFIVADMIVSGEKEGPLFPSSKPVGIIAAGYNPILFDETIATLMGFDYNKIPAIVTARGISGKYKLTNNKKACILSNDENLSNICLEDFPQYERLDFIPTSGWKGHIELK